MYRQGLSQNATVGRHPGSLNANIASVFPHWSRSNSSFVLVSSPKAATTIVRKASHVIVVKVWIGRLYVTQVPASSVMVCTAYIGHNAVVLSERPSSRQRREKAV